MGIEKATVNLNVRGIAKRFGNGEIRFDLAIQRNEVWDLARKSLFIHSLLSGFPFPASYAQDISNNKALWMLDGKQRMTTAVKYVAGEFALAADIPDVVDSTDNDETTVSIAGLKFAELPEDLQDRILTAEFLVYKLSNLTDELRDEMFLRLNNGVPLTKMELTRVVAGSHVGSFINEISDGKFFAGTIALSDSYRNRFVDDEIVMQTMLLLNNDGNAVSIQGNDVREYAKKLKADGIPDTLKDTMRNVTKYLGEALPHPDKNLKKVHIPIIFLMAVKAYENNVPPVKFGGWVQTFFARLKENKEQWIVAYSYGCKSGSAKKESVEKRINNMKMDFVQHIDFAPNYKTPESARIPTVDAVTNAAGATTGAVDDGAAGTAGDTDNQNVVDGAAAGAAELEAAVATEQVSNNAAE